MPAAEPTATLDPSVAAALERLEALVDSFERDPNPAVRERAMALLQAVDGVHRAGLTRLASSLDQLDAAARRRALADPAVRLLLDLYDVAPAHESAQSEDGFVSLADVKIVRAPRHHRLPAASLGRVPADGVLPITIGETRVLLAAVEGRVVAYRNGCGSSPMPLDAGRREGDVLVCPWHDCRIDLASGRRLDGAGDDLVSYAVTMVDGELQVELPGQVGRVAVGARS